MRGVGQRSLAFVRYHRCTCIRISISFPSAFGMADMEGEGACGATASTFFESTNAERAWSSRRVLYDWRVTRHSSQLDRSISVARRAGGQTRRQPACGLAPTLTLCPPRRISKTSSLQHASPMMSPSQCAQVASQSWVFWLHDIGSGTCRWRNYRLWARRWLCAARPLQQANQLRARKHMWRRSPS
jgi:hypothetical protein